MSEPLARQPAQGRRKTAVLRENIGEAFAVVRGHRLRS